MLCPCHCVCCPGWLNGLAGLSVFCDFIWPSCTVVDEQPGHPVEMLYGEVYGLTNT